MARLRGLSCFSDDLERLLGVMLPHIAPGFAALSVGVALVYYSLSATPSFTEVQLVFGIGFLGTTKRSAKSVFFNFCTIDAIDNCLVMLAPTACSVCFPFDFADFGCRW